MMSSATGILALHLFAALAALERGLIWVHTQQAGAVARSAKGQARGRYCLSRSIACSKQRRPTVSLLRE